MQLAHSAEDKEPRHGQFVNLIIIAFGGVIIVKTMSKHVLETRASIPQEKKKKKSANNCLFFLPWTLPSALCLALLPRPPWWETSSFIQVPLCLSFSSSQAVFKCEWGLRLWHHSTSYLSLTVQLFWSFQSQEWSQEAPIPLSTARRFAKSIAANESLDKQKPQYKLNKLR